ADGIYGQAGTRPRALAKRLVQHYRLSEVAQLSLAALTQLDALERARGRAGALAQHHLASARLPGDAGGDVHGRAEPVAIPLDRGPAVKAGPHGREVVATADLVHDLDRKADRQCGVVRTDHRRIADRLDHLRRVPASEVRELSVEQVGEVSRVEVAH